MTETTVTVADLVAAPLWAIDPGDSAAESAAVLEARSFDVAGVGQAPITRYVTHRALLDGAGCTVADLATPILAADTVAKTLPLVEVVELLRDRPFLFILDQDRVRWIVTRADLQAPVVSVVLLSYLVSIEVALAPLVRDHLGEGWFEMLPTDRRKQAQELHAKKRRNNLAIGLEDCLYFTDWLHLTSLSEQLMDELGFSSKNEFRKATGSFADLRNNLAHGGTLLDGASAAQALDRFDRVRRFAAAAWELVEHRREQWDAYAATVITDVDGSVIAGPGAADAMAFGTPAHVITAWNPGSSTRPKDENRRANRELERVLEHHEATWTKVVGSSPDRRWAEESLVTSDLRRKVAAELGERFGQNAIFELRDDEVLVVRCPDAKVMRRVPRRRA